jgi:hypothetical protein
MKLMENQAHDREHGSAAGKHDNIQRAIEKEIESEMVKPALFSLLIKYLILF